MSLTKFTAFLLCLLFVNVLFASLVPVKGAASTVTEGSLSYEDLLSGNYIDISRIEEHVRFLSSISTPRVTGYPGFYKAQEYIYDKFVVYGLENVTYQWYNITIPVDLGGSLTVYGVDGSPIKSYPAHALWPNSVQVCSTPPGGITANLFYARQGEYSDYNGHVVNESIVLLDFNSEYNWMKAFDLGAKAVVYIEPEETTNLQSYQKYLPLTPVYAPRVCLERDDAGDLLGLLNQYGGTLDVKLESKMEWQVKEVANIIGLSPGTSHSGQWMILFAHFDAWSVVPSLTKGATDACGIAGLLELIRFYTQVEHGRSIMFVAFSGYGENIQGARHFVDRLFIEDDFEQVFHNPDPNAEQGIFTVAGVDLSPETTSIGVLTNSDVQWTWDFSGIMRDWYETQFYAYGTNLMTKMRDAWNNVYGRTWILSKGDSWGVGGVTTSDRSYTPEQFVMDADAFYGTLCGGVLGRFTYRTIYAWFERKYTPVDTFSLLEDLNNLKPQLEFALCTTYDLSYKTQNLPAEGIPSYKKLSQSRPFIHSSDWTGTARRTVRVTGQAVVYNESEVEYEPLQNAIVQIFGVDASLGGPFACASAFYVTADENGFFTGPSIPTDRTHLYLPYVFNETTSRIVYAPDLGSYGAGKYAHKISILAPQGPFYGTKQSPLTVVAFECGTMEIYNLGSAEATSSLRQPPSAIGGGGQTGMYMKIMATVNDPITHASLTYYGYQQEESGPLGTPPVSTLTFFIQGNTPVEIMPTYTGATTAVVIPIGILHNSSLLNPIDGYGYTVQTGETLRILYTPLTLAKEFNNLDLERSSSMTARNIYTTGTEFLEKANQKIALAEEALNNLNYSSYYDYAVSALALEKEAYVHIKNSLSSVLSATMTSFSMVLLFAYLAERLFFGSLKLSMRALGIVALSVLGITPLVLLHPGFTMASNVYASIYGIVLLVFEVIVWSVLVSHAQSALRSFREKILGKHFVDVSRITTMMTSLGLGLAYMKKRKLRTILTLLTLIIVSLSIVLFTSITPTIITKSTIRVGEAMHTGIYTREYAQYDMMNPSIVEYVAAKIGEDKVYARAWLYPRAVLADYGYPTVGPNGTTYTVKGLYGLSPKESIWENYLKPGGLWFQETDYAVCIISEYMASQMGVKVRDFIEVMGVKIQVKGIFYPEVRNVVKLDGNYHGLRDPLNSQPGVDVFYTPEETIYVPYTWAMDHDATVREIIIEGDAELAAELATEIDSDFWIANTTGTIPIELFSRRQSIQASGFEAVSLPLAISALMVLNLMLGAIYERTKEIGIFATLGLSPTEVGMMFLSESSAFGVVGVVLGYISGIIGLQILSTYGALPPDIRPDYSSGFIVQTTGILMLLVIGSSLYPFLKASRLVTPSLERKWKIPTKPLGDQWNIPMPFFFIEEQEVTGFLEYIREYFEAYTSESAGFHFATQKTSMKKGRIEDVPYYSVVLDLHLAPFQANLYQDLEVVIRKADERYTAEIIINRRSGRNREWTMSNRKLLDMIRTQFMAWRILQPDEKVKYYKLWKKSEQKWLKLKKK